MINCIMYEYKMEKKMKKSNDISIETSLLERDTLCVVIYRIYKYNFEKKKKINISFNATRHRCRK